MAVCDLLYPVPTRPRHTSVADFLQTARIPEQIACLQRFIIWRWDFEDTRDDGKPKKPPLSPITGFKSSAHDEANHVPMGEAVEACERHGADGIGLSLAQSLGLVGIDLDDCRDPKTGFPTTEEAKDVLQLFRRTYAHVTNSDTGYRIICKGRLPEGLSNLHKAGGEAYDSKQYIAVTGWVVEGHPSEVVECAAELAEFVRRYMVPKDRPTNATKDASSGEGTTKTPSSTTPKGLARSDEHVLHWCMTQPTTGTRFRALWAGDWRSWYKSQSSADFQLCRLLFFATGGHEAQTERLFRQSALARRNKATGRDDYIPGTVASAAKKCGKVYTAQGGRPRSVQAVLPESPPQRVVKECATRQDKEDLIFALVSQKIMEHGRSYGLSCRQVQESTGIPYRTAARILKSLKDKGRLRRTKRGLWSTGMASEYDLPEFVPESFQDATGRGDEEAGSVCTRPASKAKCKSSRKKTPLPAEPLTFPPKNRIKEGEWTSVWVKQEPGRPWVSRGEFRSTKGVDGKWDRSGWIADVERRTRFAAYRVIGNMLSTRGVGSLCIEGHPALREEEPRLSYTDFLTAEAERYEAEEPPVYEDVDAPTG